MKGDPHACKERTRLQSKKTKLAKEKQLTLTKISKGGLLKTLDSLLQSKIFKKAPRTLKKSL